MHYLYNLDRSNKSVIQLNTTYPTAAEHDDSIVTTKYTYH